MARRSVRLRAWARLRPGVAAEPGARRRATATLGVRGPGAFSPEAEAARACFEATADVAAAVAGCASGRELIEGGFGDDVAIALEIDACQLVPVLAEGAFSAATGQERA